MVAACCSCGCELSGISEEACPVWHQACSHLRRKAIFIRQKFNVGPGIRLKISQDSLGRVALIWPDHTAGPNPEARGWSGRSYLISDSCLSGEFFNQKRNNIVILSFPHDYRSCDQTRVKPTLAVRSLRYRKWGDGAKRGFSSLSRPRLCWLSRLLAWKTFLRFVIVWPWLWIITLWCRVPFLFWSYWKICFPLDKGSG